MRPVENIKRLIKNAKVRINPDVKRAALEELIDELGKSKTKNVASDHTQPNTWRIIMKSKMLKFATVASVLVFIGVLYVGLTGDTVNAVEMLEEIIKLNQDYKGWIHISIVHKTLREETEDV